MYVLLEIVFDSILRQKSNGFPNIYRYRHIINNYIRALKLTDVHPCQALNLIFSQYGAEHVTDEVLKPLVKRHSFYGVRLGRLMGWSGTSARRVPSTICTQQCSWLNDNSSVPKMTCGSVSVDTLNMAKQQQKQLCLPV